MLLLAPPLRALAQLDDPAFLGVVWRSLAWALAAFAALAGALAWGADALLAEYSRWLGWLGGGLAGVAVALLCLYFFLPLATVIAALYADRIAAAVERRCYPGLPPARPAPLSAQIVEGVALGIRVLVLQVVTLLLSLIPPLTPIVVPLGWFIAAWAVGRGLFTAVAMRRMDRRGAAILYHALRPAVLAQGALIALAGLVPLLNLFVPVLGTAAMVHVLHGSRLRWAGANVVAED
jgi:uncharacterized protein involved in cysteine biosynthesis